MPLYLSKTSTAGRDMTRATLNCMVRPESHSVDDYRGGDKSSVVGRKSAC